MEEIVSIVGVPRSVTSWRCHAINHSPDICMLHETNIWGLDHSKKGKFFKNRSNYYEELSNKLVLNPFPDFKHLSIELNATPCDIEEQLHDLDIEYDICTPKFYERLAEELNPKYKIFGDKDPAYTRSLKSLWNRHPRMKFLICLRQPFYVARSMWCPTGKVDRWWKNNDPNNAINLAVREFKRLMRFLNEHEFGERCKLWKAEDLRKSGKESWMNVLNFLGAREGNIISYHNENFKYKEYMDIDKMCENVDKNLLEEMEKICDRFKYEFLL